MKAKTQENDSIQQQLSSLQSKHEQHTATAAQQLKALQTQLDNAQSDLIAQQTQSSDEQYAAVYAERVELARQFVVLHNACSQQQKHTNKVANLSEELAHAVNDVNNHTSIQRSRILALMSELETRQGIFLKKENNFEIF